MALTQTALSAAVLATDTQIAVASATGFAADNLVRVNGEVMKVLSTYISGLFIPVLRGRNGTPTQAHAITSNVITGLAGDFADPAPGGPMTFLPTIRARTTRAYGLAGAIALPTPGSDMLAILNGTSVLAMTLANPTKDMDGDQLFIIGNGKAAHTVTYTAGLGAGGGALDVLTFAAGGQQCLVLMACNGTWVPPSVLAGTLTNITVTAA
jgi:hypothetical protein